ncbi:Tn3 family transposase [Streptomyces sp. NBC_01275]|nr:Tn3 family transposase [Streptomyces sp. NBC_01275]
MIYWHVEKKSLCVYSQLKSCSASEVAAMIEACCGTARIWRSTGSAPTRTAPPSPGSPSPSPSPTCSASTCCPG